MELLWNVLFSLRLNFTILEEFNNNFALSRFPSVLVVYYQAFDWMLDKLNFAMLSVEGLTMD